MDEIVRLLIEISEKLSVQEERLQNMDTKLKETAEHTAYARERILRAEGGVILISVLMAIVGTFSFLL